MNDLYSDSAWIKISKLVSEKYGKSLSYRPIKLISGGAAAFGNTNFYSNGDDLVIPLKIKNFDLGDIIVSRGSILEQQQKIEISDLIKFLVEPKLYSLQLKKSEENLLNLNYRPLSLVENEKTVLKLYRSEKSKKRTLSQVILLKSHVEFTRHRVALKIHEMAERNLFIHLDDIAASLSTKDDIRSLSDITIYVKDIELISMALRELLSQYLEENSTEGPLFLIGSSLSLDGLQNQNWAENFKKDLMGFYFDIDRVPLSQQTSEEILELLFFQFAPNMT